MSHRLPPLTRRHFTLGALGFTGGLGLLSGRGAFAAKAKGAAPGFSIGYHAYPYGDDGITQAITDISDLHYAGIQLRKGSLKHFASPAALRAELARAHLTFVALSGGGVTADPAKREADAEEFMKGAKFAREAGASIVMATSGGREQKDTPSPETIKNLAASLDALGKRTAAIGLTLGLHNHMLQVAQDPADVDAIMAATDPRYVKLLLDTGHLAAAGGDPVAAIKKYGDRLCMLHIKDVVDKPDNPGKKKYLFVELGTGKVDFPGVFAALKAVKYKGWVVVELDTVTPGRTAKDDAAACKAFLEKKMGLSVQTTRS